MMEIKAIEEITMIHWFLAYASLVGKLCFDISQSDGPVKDIFTRKHVFRTIASIIFVPVLMIVCTDTWLKSIFPINYGTAFLVGFNTELVLFVIVKLKTKEFKKKTDEKDS